jgi:hypothetical protein
MSNIINSLWISGPLRPVNLLTIRSFKEYGHEPVIWSYDPTITTECRVEDPRDILPESEIFYYKTMMGGNPRFKFGGIAERLKAHLLYELGGWHVDLDVTCLHSFATFYPTQYTFRSHEKGVVANIIKAPKHSEMAARYINWTKRIDENNDHWEKSFLGLNKIIADLELGKYIAPVKILGNDNRENWELYLKNNRQEPHSLMHAIHWCGAMGMTYEEGSFYHSLLKKYHII